MHTIKAVMVATLENGKVEINEVRDFKFLRKAMIMCRGSSCERFHVSELQSGRL